MNNRDRKCDNDSFLASVGQRVHSARTEQALSRTALSKRCNVSTRYLAQLESGQGNISISLLKRVSDALGVGMESIVSTPTTRARDKPDGRVALIGLRGAGKSTLGRQLAHRLGWSFIELTDRIEAQGGMPIAEIFSLYGQDGYRRLEKEALEAIIGNETDLVLAVAGGIVSARDNFDLLLARFQTVWLKAQPEDHMERVRKQGDHRPMGGNPDAMANLRGILAAREHQYNRAGDVLDTTARTETQSARELAALVAGGNPVDGAAGKH